MPYSVLYALAWVNAAIGVVAGVLAAAYPLAHPSWLSADIALTCGLLVPVSVGLAALLPAVTRTPDSREVKYLAAQQGRLPDDLARKQAKPFDTL